MRAFLVSPRDPLCNAFSVSVAKTGCTVRDRGQVSGGHLVGWNLNPVPWKKGNFSKIEESGKAMLRLWDGLRGKEMGLHAHIWENQLVWN